MRRVLLIDRPVDDAALLEAQAVMASEIVYCVDGVPPPALGPIAMGYHEIPEPGDEP